MVVLPSRGEIVEMLASASLGGPERSIGFVLWRMTHRFQRIAEQALRPLNLTYLQLVVLGLSARIGLEKPVLVQADIARFSGIHPMQISTVLKALERKKMIRRLAAPGAAKQVKITAQGLEALRAAFPPMQEVQTKLFGKEGAPQGTLLELLLGIDKQQAGMEPAFFEVSTNDYRARPESRS